MRRLRVLFVAGLALCCARSVAAGEPYVVGPGDELRVVVADRPELSGVFTISPDGTLALPALDGLKLDGLEVRAVAAAVRQKLEERYVNLTLAVEVSRYRPFFILGDVATPGAYPWQPEFTLAKAVALAGGYRSKTDVFQASVTGIRAAESYAAARRELGVERLVKARLEAELDPKADLKLPQNTQDVVATQAVQRQQEILRTKTELLKKQVSLLETQQNNRGSEIGALEGRVAAQGRLAEQLSTELRGLKAYNEKGLVPISRLNELTREESRVQSDALQTSVLLNQARQARTQAELQLVSVVRERNLSVLSALEVSDGRIARLEVQMRADAAVVSESESTLGVMATLRPQFQIVRSAATGEVAVEDERTPVRPGDVITVRRSADARQAR